MDIIFNERCSKCMSLSNSLSNSGIEWNALKYLNGELSKDVLDRIFDGYSGHYSDLVRTGEGAWINSGHDINQIDIEELKNFIMENPIVLQRPIVMREGKIVIARTAEKVNEVLGN